MGGALCIKTEMTGLNVVWCVVIRKKGGICFIVQKKKSKTEVKNAMHGRKTKRLKKKRAKEQHPGFERGPPPYY